MLDCDSIDPGSLILFTPPRLLFTCSTSAPVTSAPSNHRPGFRLILTAIHDTTSGTCPQSQFYCGPRPSYSDSKSHSPLPQHPPQSQHSSSSVSFTHLGLAYSSGSSVPSAAAPASSSSASSSVSSSSLSVGSPSLSAASVSTSSASLSRSDPAGSSARELSRAVLGYCIPDRTVCDGIANCADSRDESVARCGEPSSGEHPWRGGPDRKSSGLLHGFLSLGIPASIAIAVSTIVTFTVCIGAVICCCNRCCGTRRSYPSRYPRIVAGSARMHALDASLPASAGYPVPHAHPHHTSGSSSAVIMRGGGGPGSATRAQFTSWLNRGRPIHGTEWHSQVTPFSQQQHQQPPGYMPFCSYSGSQQSSVAHMFSVTAGSHGPGTDQKLAYQHTQPDFVMRSSMMKPSRDEMFPVAHSADPSVTSNCMPLPSSIGAPSSDSYSSIHANSSIQASYPVYPRPPGPPPALIHGVMGSPVTYRRDTSGTDPCSYTPPPPYGACTVPPASSVTASSSRTGTTSGGGGPGVHASSHAAWLSRGPVAPESGLMTAGGSIDGVVSASATDLCHIGSNGILFGHQLSGGGNSVLHTNTPVETISTGGGMMTGAPPRGCTSGDLVSNGGILYLGELAQPLSGEDSSMRFRGYSCGPGSTTTGSASSRSGMPTNSSQRSGEAPNASSQTLPVSEQMVSFPVQL
ncbi:unnamed protein product [Echinostoma caproni]|uniref:Vesicular, overexpressed in cancer, prosurvival protein 1 n=1 Tax=Echinostoma caproni TaxID=27848 RepID=A0A183AF48_9TREM|nr:unnamed protein product [Echinostoma caproni]